MNAQTETKPAETPVKRGRGRGRPKKTEKAKKPKQTPAQIIKKQEETIEELRKHWNKDFDIRIQQQEKLKDAIEKIKRANKYINEYKEKSEKAEKTLKEKVDLINALERELRKQERINFFLSKVIYINNGGNA